MRPQDALVFGAVVESLHVVEVRDIECGDVITEGEGEISELSVVGDVRVDSEIVATWPGPAAVASAADSGFPGMNFTS